MITRFGIKEAIAAGVFAKTREQKLTVLATMAMLGIKNGISKQIEKKRTKVVNKLVASRTKAKALNVKLEKLGAKDVKQTDTLFDLDDVSINWSL